MPLAPQQPRFPANRLVSALYNKETKCLGGNLGCLSKPWGQGRYNKTCRWPDGSHHMRIADLLNISIPVAWTSATHCTTASLASWCDVCTRCTVECCGQADHWHTTMWPHVTGASGYWRYLQDRHARLSVSVRSRPKLHPYLAGDCRLVTDADWQRTWAYSDRHRSVTDECDLILMKYDHEYVNVCECDLFALNSH